MNSNEFRYRGDRHRIWPHTTGPAHLRIIKFQVDPPVFAVIAKSVLAQRRARSSTVRCQDTRVSSSGARSGDIHWIGCRPDLKEEP